MIVNDLINTLIYAQLEVMLSVTYMRSELNEADSYHLSHLSKPLSYSLAAAESFKIRTVVGGAMQ